MLVSKMVEEIENTLAIAYFPGAIQYIDDNYNCAWSNAINIFEVSMMRSLENPDTYFEVMELSGDVYKTSILKFIEIYKAFKTGQKINLFLSSLSDNKDLT